jgi:hypothetical protein
VDEGSAGVGEESLAEELAELDLVAEEGAGDVDALASDDCNSLACIGSDVPESAALAI